MPCGNNDVTVKPRKTRRSSILKKYNQGNEEILDADDDETTSFFSKSSRRVSFGRKSIKVFSECPQQTGTIWQNSFEEPLKLDLSNENVSKVSNKNKRVPQRTTLFDENRSYGNMEMTQNVNDKENTIYQYDPALDNTEVLCNINPNTIFMVNKENIAPPLAETIIFDKDMTCSNLDMTDLPLSIDKEKGGVVVAVKQFRNKRRKTIHFDPNSSGNMNCTQVLTEDVFFESNVSLHRYPGTDQNFPIFFNSDKSCANIGMTEVLPDTVLDHVLPPDGSSTSNKSLQSESQYVPLRKTIYYNPDRSCADIEMTGVLPDTDTNYVLPSDGPCTTNKSLQSGSQFVPSRKTIYFNPDKSCADIEMTGVLSDTDADYVLPSEGPCTTNKYLQSGSQFVPSRKTIYFNPDKSCADIDMTEVLSDTISDSVLPSNDPCTTNKSLKSESQFVPSRKTIYYNPDKSCADIEMTGVLSDTNVDYVLTSDGPYTTNKSLQSGSPFIPSRKTIFFNPNKSCADVDMTDVLSDTIHDNVPPRTGSCSINKSLQSGSQILPSRKNIYFSSDKPCTDFEITGVLPITHQDKSILSSSAACFADDPSRQNPLFAPSRKTIYFNSDKTSANIEMTGVLSDTIQDNVQSVDRSCSTNKSLKDDPQFVSSRKTIYYNSDKSSANIEMTGVLSDIIQDNVQSVDGSCSTNKFLKDDPQFVPSRKTIYYNSDKSSANIEMTGVLSDTIQDNVQSVDGSCSTNKFLKDDPQFVPSRKTIYYNSDKSSANIEMTGVLSDTIQDNVQSVDGSCSTNKFLKDDPQFVPSRKTIYYNSDKSSANIEMTGVLSDTIQDNVQSVDRSCSTNKSLKDDPQFVPSRKTICYNSDKSSANIEMTGVLSDIIQHNMPPLDDLCTLKESLQSGSQILPSRKTICLNSDNTCADIEISGVLPITNQDKSIPSSSASYFPDNSTQQNPSFVPPRKAMYYSSDIFCADIQMKGVLPDAIQGKNMILFDETRFTDKSLQLNQSRKIIFCNSTNNCSLINVSHPMELQESMSFQDTRFVHNLTEEIFRQRKPKQDMLTLQKSIQSNADTNVSKENTLLPHEPYSIENSSKICNFQYKPYENLKVPTLNEELLQDISFDFNNCSPFRNSPNAASQTNKINTNNSFKLLNIEEVFALATNKFEKTVNSGDNKYQKPINSTAKPTLNAEYSNESWNEIAKSIRSMHCNLPKVTSPAKTEIEYKHAELEPVKDTEKELYVGAKYPITPSIKELIINKCKTMLIWKDNEFFNKSCCFTGFKQRIWNTNSEALIRLYIFLDGDINEADTRITDIKLEPNFLKCKEYNELLQLSFIREMNYNMSHYHGSVENIFHLLEDTNLGLGKIIDFYAYLKKLVNEAQFSIIGTRLEFSINCGGWMEFEVDVSRCLRGAFKKEDVIVLEGNENIHLQQFLSLMDNVTDDDNFAYNYVKLCLENVKVFIGMC